MTYDSDFQPGGLFQTPLGRGATSSLVHAEILVCGRECVTNLSCTGGRQRNSARKIRLSAFQLQANHPKTVCLS